MPISNKKFITNLSMINSVFNEFNEVKLIDTQNEKYNVLDGYSKRLALDLKKEKVKNKFKSIVGTGMIAVLTFFLITK